MTDRAHAPKPNRKDVFRARSKYERVGNKPIAKNVKVLRDCYNEVTELAKGLLGRNEKSEAFRQGEALELIEKVGEKYFTGCNKKSLLNDVKIGIQMAMIMQAYKRCGVGSIAAFYYLLGEYNFEALAKLGTKTLPKTVVESGLTNITYAEQINIRPFSEPTQQHADVDDMLGGIEVIETDATSNTVIETQPLPQPENFSPEQKIIVDTPVNNSELTKDDG